MDMEHSAYENPNKWRQQRQEGIALGRITRVFRDRRMCEVKTFMGAGDKDDNHIPYAQWLNLDAHPDGDESTIVPREGSYCVVFFIAGEPFISFAFVSHGKSGSTFVFISNDKFRSSTEASLGE